jgi:hypothetical protein
MIVGRQFAHRMQPDLVEHPAEIKETGNFF